MMTVLTIWLLAAFYTAVWSAYRVWERRATIGRHSSRQQTFFNAVDDVDVPEADMAQRSPDRSLTADISTPLHRPELPAELDAALTANAAADLPLATAVPLSEVVNPADTTPPIEIDLGTAHHSTVAPSEHQVDSPHHVLTEIAQLDQEALPDPMAQLGQYLDHPDSLMRSALASVLGEMAIKRQGHNVEQILTALNTLTTDANLQVRTEAMAALGRIGTELGIVQSNAG